MIQLLSLVTFAEEAVTFLIVLESYDICFLVNILINVLVLKQSLVELNRTEITHLNKCDVVTVVLSKTETSWNKSAAIRTG